MDKITFCMPSKSNLRYLKSAIPSIRKNAYRKDHDIIIFVDEDKDGTIEWLDQVKDSYNVKYYVNPNLNKELFGIGRAYDFCIDKTDTEIVMIFHADMYLAKNADYEAFKYLKPQTVVCSTRIEPPLHPEGPDKIVKNFGLWPEVDQQDGFLEDEFNKFIEVEKLKNINRTTIGIFAPWMIYKADFKKIGGHDYSLKSYAEDRDLFNRMYISGIQFLQSWESFVYHLTARGGALQDNNLKKIDKNWQDMKNISIREFIRKWKSMPLHDHYLNPIIAPNYNIGIKLFNCSEYILEYIEPWCDNLYIDCNVDEYVKAEQKNTICDLNKKILSIKEIPKNDIILEIDANSITNQTLNIVQSISSIINDQNLNPGSYSLNNIKLLIKRK